jgi:hypothetical protein
LDWFKGESLPETMVFAIKYRVSWKFSHKPIALWVYYIRMDINGYSGYINLFSGVMGV